MARLWSCNSASRWSPTVRNECWCEGQAALASRVQRPPRAPAAARCLLAVACVVIALIVPPPRVVALASPLDSCASYTVGIDPSRVDTALVNAFCGGWGQVFQAQDTLIRSISVWRPALPAADPYPYRLFITSTDGTGRPTPGTYISPILTGPALVIPMSDSLRPVRYQYLFDPPVALPYRGLFTFSIVSTELSLIRVLGVTTNWYPQGQAWFLDGDSQCLPSDGYSRGPNIDIAFEIEFCSLGPTTVQKKSWGQLKILYR